MATMALLLVSCPVSSAWNREAMEGRVDAVCNK